MLNVCSGADQLYEIFFGGKQNTLTPSRSDQQNFPSLSEVGPGTAITVMLQPNKSQDSEFPLQCVVDFRGEIVDRVSVASGR